jgi:hypothetical protein
LKVGFGGLEERYISRVVGRPFESVTVSLNPIKIHYKADWIGIGYSSREEWSVYITKNDMYVPIPRRLLISRVILTRFTSITSRYSITYT